MHPHVSLKCRIRRIPNNKRWQITSAISGKVLGGSKTWRKAFNRMVMEQQRVLNYFGKPLH